MTRTADEPWLAPTVTIGGMCLVAFVAWLVMPRPSAVPMPRQDTQDVTPEPASGPLMAPPLHRIEAHPTRPEWLLALGPDRTSFVTRDRGRTWAPVQVAASWIGRGLRVPDPTPGWDADGRLLAVRGDQLFTSVDGGLTFEAELLGSGLVGLWPASRRPRVRSGRIAGAATWEVLSGRDGPVLRRLGKTVADPAHPPPAPHWRIGAHGPEFLPPGTTTWEPRARGADAPVAMALAQSASDADQVGLVTTAGELWSSPDVGRTWARQPVEEARQATAVQTAPPGTWLVRHPELTFTLIRDSQAEPMGPTVAELMRLAVPPYLERPRDLAHQRTMLLRLIHQPEVTEAGFTDDGSLWIHLSGVDAMRDRWIRDPSGQWTSEVRPREVRRLAAWGSSPNRRCRTSLHSGEAFLGDAPIRAKVGLGLALGWASETELYLVGTDAAELYEVHDDCSIVSRQSAWTWRGSDVVFRLAVASADPADRVLHVLGADESGVYRLTLELPPAAATERS